MYACMNVLTKLMNFQQIVYLLWVNKCYGYGYGYGYGYISPIHSQRLIYAIRPFVHLKL